MANPDDYGVIMVLNLSVRYCRTGVKMRLLICVGSNQASPLKTRILSVSTGPFAGKY